MNSFERMIHTMKYDAVRARVCELTEEQKGISLECIDKALEGLDSLERINKRKVN